MFFCISVTTGQDVVMQLHTCVVVVKMKTNFEDGCDLSKGAESRGVGSREEAITLLAHIHFRWWMAVFWLD